MDLIILESPNKVRDVERYARVLGFEAKAIATVGHLVDLPPMTEGAAVDTSTFALRDLRPRDAAARERIARIRAAIGQSERVIVATDPDREGEAIAGEIWSWIPRAKAWRAAFEEITPAGIERGLGQMRQALAASAVEAAHARRAIDRLAGWHGTALVFDKLRQHKGLSAGRLQSAALRLIVERHREHEGFRPTTSYGLRVLLRSATGDELLATVVDESGTARDFPTDDEARAMTLPTSVCVTDADARRREQRPRRFQGERADAQKMRGRESANDGGVTHFVVREVLGCARIPDRVVRPDARRGRTFPDGPGDGVANEGWSDSQPHAQRDLGTTFNTP